LSNLGKNGFVSNLLVSFPRDSAHKSGPQCRPEYAAPDPSIGRVPPQPAPARRPLFSGGRPGARLGGSRRGARRL